MDDKKSPEQALEEMHDAEPFILPSWKSIVGGVTNIGNAILEPAYVVHDTVVVVGNSCRSHENQAYANDLPLVSGLGQRLRDNVNKGKGAGAHVRAAVVSAAALPTGGGAPLVDSVVTVVEEDMTPQQAADFLGGNAATQTTGAIIAVTAARGTGRSPGGNVEVAVRNNGGKSHSSVAATVEASGKGPATRATSQLRATESTGGFFENIRNKVGTKLGPDLGFGDGFSFRGRALAQSVLDAIRSTRGFLEESNGGRYGYFNNCHAHSLGLFLRGSLAEFLHGLQSPAPGAKSGAAVATPTGDGRGR